MHNLTQSGIHSPNFTLREKIGFLLRPEVYYAESVADFKENRSNIHYPAYKIYPTPHILDIDYAARVHVILYNVGIRLIEKCSEKHCDFFEIHDDSGVIVALWNHENGNYFVPDKTFEELQREQGLQEKDWAYRLNLVQIKAGARFISDITRTKSKSRSFEKESLIEKISKFLPCPEPIPAPSY